MSRLACAVVIALSIPAVAGAEPVARAEDRAETASPGGSATATATAAVPGLIAHGAGHWVLGERTTARRLLIGELVGLGVAALGGVPILATGASSRLSGPGIPLVVTGTGTLIIGWLADIYGSSGAHRLTGDPAADLPPLAVEVGYAYVDDPQFAYGSFAVARAELGWRQLYARPSVWVATGDDNQRWRGEVAYRRPSTDGSRLEFAGATTFHEYGGDGFDVFGLEALVRGRLDLARVGPTLRGSFAELSVGVGSERIAYDDRPSDWNGNLLGGFAFGVYLGAGRGELAVYYDHRRDDYAGGLATARGGGFLGHFGVAGHHRIAGGWSIGWELERGAANIAQLVAGYRFGAAR